MAHSYADHPEITCPHCGQISQTEVWLIVDIEKRPNLLERIQEDTLHDVACIHCGQEVGQADAPLLIYRPSQTPPLLFFPAGRTTG